MNLDYHTIALILFPIGSFVIGGLPFSYLAGRMLAGIDLRTFGSGSAGALNAYQVLGRGPGTMVFILEALKSSTMMILAQTLTLQEHAEFASAYVALQGLLTCMGHIWSPFLKMRGGLGVSTLLGIFAVLSPKGTLASVLGSLLLAFLFKKPFLGILMLGIFLPLGYVFFSENYAAPEHLSILVLMLFSSLLIFFRYRQILKRIRSGRVPGLFE